MIFFQIEQKLVHGAAGAGAGPEQQDLFRPLQGLGDRFLKTLLLGLSLAVGIVLVVAKVAAKAEGVIGCDLLRD